MFLKQDAPIFNPEIFGVSTIICDGSSRNGNIGIAACINGEFDEVMATVRGHGSSNMAEIMAIKWSLLSEFVGHGDMVIIYTDNQRSIDILGRKRHVYTTPHLAAMAYEIAIIARMRGLHPVDMDNIPDRAKPIIWDGAYKCYRGLAFKIKGHYNPAPDHPDRNIHTIHNVVDKLAGNNSTY